MYKNTDTTIWVLDSCQRSRAFYSDTLSELYPVTLFESFFELTHQMQDTSNWPSLLIADPQAIETTGHLFTKVPTVVISSKDCSQQIELCHRLGVLDYLSKPIGKNALLYKIKKIIQTPVTADTKQFFEKLGHLTLKERFIVEFLLERANHEASRKEIMDYVWKNVKVTSKTLDVHLYHLRRKIRPHGFDVAAIDGKMRLQETAEEASQKKLVV